MRCYPWLFLVGLLLAGAGQLQAATPDESRARIREQSVDVLERLYGAEPDARAAVEDAYGYATFQNLGLKVGVAGTGRGRGVAIRNEPRGETFMRFVELEAGIGVGIKRYDLVFVFETREAFDEFVAGGWEPSGQSTLALRHDQAGASFDGAIALQPGVWLYQLTSRGLAAEVTIKGSKYYRDKDLSPP